MIKRRHDLPPDSFRGLRFRHAAESIRTRFLDAQSSSRATMKRRAPTRGEAAHHYRNSPQIQPLPRWAKGDAGAQDRRQDDAFGDALATRVTRSFSPAQGSRCSTRFCAPARAAPNQPSPACLRQRLALQSRRGLRASRAAARR